MCRQCQLDGLTDRHKGKQPKPKPAFTPETESTLELAWAAGFFDGEGWTSIHTAPPSRSNPALPRRRYLQVGVAQVDVGLLKRFRAAVGVGTINTSRRTSQWRAHNYEAVRAVERLWPLLGRPKRQQFLRVYEVIS